MERGKGERGRAEKTGREEGKNEGIIQKLTVINYILCTVW